VKRILLLLPAVITASSGLSSAASLPIETFPAYIDSDICARLMLGAIDDERISCGVKTYKNGAGVVVIRLQNNLVLTPNKDKMVNKLVGKYAKVSGQVKVSDGSLKLDTVTEESASNIPAIDPNQKRGPVNPQLHEKVRHELAMMPYISEFDFISFTMNGPDVILTGWTIRNPNRYEAYNRVKGIAGVGTIVNNIDVLPLGSMDMQIRAGARAALQRNLGRYFWGSGSDIKIVVKNGDIILLGTVTNQGDSDLANIQCNSVPNAFHVFNLLRVSEPKKGKG
jgi:BON domain